MIVYKSNMVLVHRYSHQQLPRWWVLALLAFDFGVLPKALVLLDDDPQYKSLADTAVPNTKLYTTSVDIYRNIGFYNLDHGPKSRCTMMLLQTP
jgi:hypothetical protein